MRLRRRSGFSFIELLLTMAIIGLLARLGVPRYREMKLRATAATIMGDVHAIRIAAFTHYTEQGAFPPDAGAGPSWSTTCRLASRSITRTSITTGTSGLRPTDRGTPKRS